MKIRSGNRFSLLNWKIVPFVAILVAPEMFAAPGIISATASAGAKAPIRIGEQITVTLQIDGYTDPAEIDGFNIVVNYDTNLLSFVGGSLNLGDATGPDQQWLSKPNQEDASAGFRLTPFVNTSPGKLFLSVVDLGFNEPESGTLADSGFLASFKLQAIGEGTAKIELEPFAGGTILFSSSLSRAGVPLLLGENKIKIKRSK